jgi:hypothetical protein
MCLIKWTILFEVLSTFPFYAGIFVHWSSYFLNSCMKSWINKVIHKVRQRWHRNPLFGHIGDEISKNGRKKKRYTGLQLGMKLSLTPNCPVISFPQRLQTITADAMCPVIINVLEPSPFNPGSQHFIPLFNKISWLCRQQPGGDEASNEGCNSGPTGRDFTDNSNVHQEVWNLLESRNEGQATHT